MVRQGLKNYFSSLRYFFTPLGTMFLGMMIGFSILIPGVLGAVGVLASGVKELAARLDLDVNALLREVWGHVTALDWSSPLSALRALLSAEWLRATATAALETILGTDFQTFELEIAALVTTFISSVKANFAVLFLWLAIGFIAGFFIVRFQIRKDLAKRSLWKLLLATVLNSLFTSVFVVAAGALLLLTGWSLPLSFVLLLLLVGLISLIEAYLIHGRGKVPAREIVTPKNAGLAILTNFLVFFISLLFTLLACLINRLMGVFVGLALLEIAVTVTDLNAEAYVKYAVGEALKKRGAAEGSEEAEAPAELSEVALEAAEEAQPPERPSEPPEEAEKAEPEHGPASE